MTNSIRKPEETQEDYRKRLKEDALALKAKLRGTLVWNSTERGKYNKPVDVTPEPKTKPKLAEVGGDPVYATGESIGQEQGDVVYAGETDHEPMYFKETPKTE